MFAWIALFSSAFAIAPLEVRVDPDVTSVKLVCGSDSWESKPHDGVATFDRAPDNCQVLVTRPAGQINGPGIYTCTGGTCVYQDTPHRPVSNAPGRLNVVFTGAYDTQWLELKCDGGFRERVDITENAGTFDGVPSGECTLLFKGATPAQYRPVTTGTYKCRLTGITAVCDPFKP